MRTLLSLAVAASLLVGCGDEPTVFEDEDTGVTVEEAGMDTNVPEVEGDTSAGEDTKVDTTVEDATAPDAASDVALEAATDGASADTGSVASDSGTVDSGASADSGGVATDTGTVPTDSGAATDTSGADAPVVCSTVACTTDGQCAAVGCGKCLGAGKCGN